MKDLHSIPPHRRDLYLRIVDSVKMSEEVHPITQRLYFLDDHFPPEKLDRALQWLVSNNFIGWRFKNWFKYICSNSDLEMHRILLHIVDNQALGPVIAGKNFKT